MPSRGSLGGAGVATGVGVIDGSAGEVPCRLDRRLRTLLALLMNLSNLGGFSPAVPDVASPEEVILLSAPGKSYATVFQRDAWILRLDPLLKSTQGGDGETLTVVKWGNVRPWKIRRIQEGQASKVKLLLIKAVERVRCINTTYASGCRR